MKNALLLSLVVIALSSCGQEGDGNLASDPSTPEYIVADRVNLMVGGIYGDVVVPSLSSSVSLITNKSSSSEDMSIAPSIRGWSRDRQHGQTRTM